MCLKYFKKMFFVMICHFPVQGLKVQRIYKIWYKIKNIKFPEDNIVYSSPAIFRPSLLQ